MKLAIQNSRDVKNIQKLLNDQFDSEFLISDYAVFTNSKNKVFLIDKKVAEVDFEKLRINSLGMYFGELVQGFIRLSIEGSQVVGPSAKKGVIELSDEEAKQWMQGDDMQFVEFDGYFLIKNNNDFLGCGRVYNQKLYNYVPKERRI